jgi:hypothetical protein
VTLRISERISNNTLRALGSTTLPRLAAGARTLLADLVTGRIRGLSEYLEYGT